MQSKALKKGHSEVTKEAMVDGKMCEVVGAALRGDGFGPGGSQER